MNAIDDVTEYSKSVKESKKDYNTKCKNVEAFNVFLSNRQEAEDKIMSKTY